MGRGMLVFKGEKPKKKKSKSKHSVEKEADQGSSATLPEAPLGRPQETSKLPPPKIVKGTGSITTSGTVVTGHGTRFSRELDVGDALIVNSLPEQEMRVVTMRLSDTSLNLSSAFSQNLAQLTEFQYIRKPRDKVKEARAASLQAAKEVKEIEQRAAGTYGSEDFVYRERTEHGNYRIKKVKADKKGLTRADMLEMRSKKTSDKYC